jgi:hypothetical protein
MTDQNEKREQIKTELREEFDNTLDQLIKEQLDLERDVAVADFIDEWEERCCEELRESLSDEFEEKLDERVNAEMAEWLQQETAD